MKHTKWMSKYKHLLVPCSLVAGILLALVLRSPMSADNGDGARGAAIGGLVGGAALGAATRSRWGAVAGLGAGALIGGAVGSRGRSYDPYQRREYLSRRIYSTRSDAKRARYQAELNDLNARLGGSPAY